MSALPQAAASTRPAPSVAVILSTYNEPGLLDLCLYALARQDYPAFEIVIADDGSGPETRALIERFAATCPFPVRHVWQEDDGFRKTRILNKAVLATATDYLVFIDGDCVVRPDFVTRHLQSAAAGSWLAGSIIRLNARATKALSRQSVDSGAAFRAGWLTRAGGKFDRRFLRLSFGPKVRAWLDRHTTTRPHWMGSNSSCFRADALAVNGFDHRFTYGFEDADFGQRLMNLGIEGRNVRWRTIALHQYHGRPYVEEGMRERNLALVTPLQQGGKTRADEGIEELRAKTGSGDA